MLIRISRDRTWTSPAHPGGDLTRVFEEFEKAGIGDHDYHIGQFSYEVIVVSV